jgi:hypothetical protein
MLNFCVLLWPFWKWRPVEIVQCRESIRDIIIIDSRHWKISTGRHFQNSRRKTTQIPHCPISTPFHMWVHYDVSNWFLTAILKMATGRNFSMSGLNSGHHYLPTYQIVMISDNVEFLRIVVAILKMATSRNCSMSGMMSWIQSRHWKISTGRHFQNGRHNTTQIQHCPISTPFHMWVHYDVSNWFLTLNNFYRSPVAILKMATSRNFSMSGINSGHH